MPPQFSEGGIISVDLTSTGRDHTSRDRDQERIDRMRLMDDKFMSIVFDSNIEATECVLRIILQRDDLSVMEVVPQREIRNIAGRSVCLDILARDEQCIYYDIEIQRSDSGADARRARFYSSMLDTKLLKDGAHIIYVNGAYVNDENDLGKLLHDFRCTNASEMYFKILADRVRYFKEPRGESNMSNVFDELYDEGYDKGYDNGTVKGIHDTSIEFALELLRRGRDTKYEIASLTKLPIEEIEQLSREA